MTSSCPGFTDPVVLPASGIYTLFIDPSGATTGTATVTLYDVPPDASGSTTVNGAAVGLTTTVPGQNAAVTFPGSASQSVTVRVTNNTVGCIDTRLLKPDGTQLSATSSCASTFTLGPVTLPAAGTYTLQIDPQQALFGSLTVNVTNP